MSTKPQRTEHEGNRCSKCGELFQWDAGWRCLNCSDAPKKGTIQLTNGIFYFPADGLSGQLFRRSYDTVEFDGTLERVADPIQSLKQARGLLKRSGILKINTAIDTDIPAIISGIVWSPNRLREIVETAGFFITDVKVADSKLYITAMPEVRVERVNIYGPPGVGDAIWSLNKIKAIREREAPCRINYTTCANQFEGSRAFDLLNSCKILDSCSFEELPLPRGEVCPDVSIPAYNLFANPHVDAGKPLSEWLPEYACDFDIQFELPQAVEDQVRARMGDRKYSTVYFASNAWNEECTAGQAWTPKEWAATCIYLNSIGLKPLVLGKSWDATYINRVAEEIIIAGDVPGKVWINMCDKTTFLLAMGLMKNAEITVGSGSSGLTITAAYLGYNVLTVWPKPGILPVEPYLCTLIKDGFSTKWMPPDVMALGRYTALHFGEFTVDDIKQNIQRMTGGSI